MRENPFERRDFSLEALERNAGDIAVRILTSSRRCAPRRRAALERFRDSVARLFSPLL